MKHYFFPFLTALILLCNCTNPELMPIDPEFHTINAIMENDGTKTSVTDAGYFTWSGNDQIWLQTTSGSVVGTLETGADTPNATFKYGYTLGELTGKAVYPYNERHDVSGNELTINLPAVYDLGSNLGNTNAAMYGILSNGNLKFNHLAGVMRFHFKDVPIGTNQFKITLDKKINGTFTADLSNSYPTICSGETDIESEKTITINFDAIQEIQDIRIYVPLPIGTYNSLALELNTSEENVMRYSKSVTNTINRKTLLLMPAVSMGGSIGGDIENDGTVGGDIENDENENDGAYLTFKDGTSANHVIYSSTSQYSKIYLDTNIAKEDLTIENPVPENGGWAFGSFWEDTDGIYYRLNVSNNTTFARTVLLQIKSKTNDLCIDLKVSQESGIQETFSFNSILFGSYNAHVKEVSSESLTFWIEAEPNEQANALKFDTNFGVAGVICEISETAQGWLEYGLGVDNNCIVLTIPANQQATRNGVVYVKSRHTGKLYYTINVIQGGNDNAYKNLSDNGTANCYIVSEAGAYKFYTKKGNSSNSVSSIRTAEVLWESGKEGSLIKSVEYAASNGEIRFETTNSFVEGNAVIAAKDANGKILWSWHVWLTDVPQEHNYKSGAVMLDRNIGATTADLKSDASAGLLYQWGRKDPFRGAKSMTDNDASPISTSKTWPSPVTSDASTGTIAYAIENPMTFITGNNSNFDWMYTGDSTVDDTRWASQKTMYDPCPVGWRVPDGGENGAWVGITKDSWDYSYHTVKTWVNNDTYANYPAAPYLNEGNMVDPEEAEGWYGHYWSCTSKGNGRFYEFTLWYPGYLNQTTSYKVPEYGYSVRCQKEN